MKLAYSWPSAGADLSAPFSDDVMMAPIVLNLNDDNCDGKITDRDIPEIVFTSFVSGMYSALGTVHAITIEGGTLQEEWSVPSLLKGETQLAGGKLGVAGTDDPPGNQLVGCGMTGVVALDGRDGSTLWTSDAMDCGFPAIADLDGDGKPEVIVEGGILDGATGKTKATFVPPMEGTFAVSDLDGDGQLDIITTNRGYHADGTSFVDNGLTGFGYGTGDAGYTFFQSGPGIGDLDLDGKPEVIGVDFNTHSLVVWRYDPTATGKFSFVRQSIDLDGTIPASHCGAMSAGNIAGGGPVTVGDFNHDGVPDVALAGGVGYAVFDGKKLVDQSVAGTDCFLWAPYPTQDCSSAGTGSSLFDFDGDGETEVIYADETTLRVFDGSTGTVLYSTCNTSGTLSEYPLVADVDNDGFADLVVVSNAYATGSGTPPIGCVDSSGAAIPSTAGVRIFDDAGRGWVRTRQVWNEHSYHVTNVNVDGTIPTHELPNFTQPGLNNFRQNKQPGEEFAAPDAIVSLLAPRCGGVYGLVATVRNIGEAPLPPGVVVGFYEGAPPTGKKLGQAVTTLTLYPAQGQAVTLELPNADAMLKNGQTGAYAVVDDTTTPHPGWTECRTDNDTSSPVSVMCSAPH